MRRLPPDGRDGGAARTDLALSDLRRARDELRRPAAIARHVHEGRPLVGATSTGSRSGRTRVAARPGPSLARPSAVWRTASACGPSSSSGRLRWRRRPRSTWAIASVPAHLGDVDQQAEVDAVALHEREPLEERRRPAYSPESGCTIEASWGNRAAITGRAISSVTRPPPWGLPSSGPVVEALHEVDVRAGEQRAHQADDEVGGEVADVGVAPGDEVAAGRGHGLVERLALALAGPQLGQHVVDRQHPGAGVGRDARRCRRWSGRPSRGSRPPARSPRRGRCGSARRSAPPWRPRRAPAGTR